MHNQDAVLVKITKPNISYFERIFLHCQNSGAVLSRQIQHIFHASEFGDHLFLYVDNVISAFVDFKEKYLQ